LFDLYRNGNRVAIHCLRAQLLPNEQQRAMRQLNLESAAGEGNPAASCIPAL
jgi:hypothetical protein